MTDSISAPTKTLIIIYFLNSTSSFLPSCNNPTKYHFIIVNGVTKPQPVLSSIVSVSHANLVLLKKTPGSIKIGHAITVKNPLKGNLLISKSTHNKEESTFKTLISPWKIWLKFKNSNHKCQKNTANIFKKRYRNFKLLSKPSSNSSLNTNLFFKAWWLKCNKKKIKTFAPNQ